MYQKENQNSFTQKVKSFAQKIPKGKVATYGQLAKLAGSPGGSRAVGMIMSKNDSPKTLPCHRVVSSTGKLTGYAFGGIIHKKEILEKEGVVFINKNTIDLKSALWHP